MTEARWRVKVAARVERHLARLVRADRERILRAFLALRDGTAGMDVKPLHGRPEWRLRVGRWRVLLQVDHEARTFYAVAVGPRGDIYK